MPVWASLHTKHGKSPALVTVHPVLCTQVVLFVLDTRQTGQEKKVEGISRKQCYLDMSENLIWIKYGCREQLSLLGFLASLDQDISASIPSRLLSAFPGSWSRFLTSRKLFSKWQSQALSCPWLLSSGQIDLQAYWTNEVRKNPWSFTLRKGNTLLLHALLLRSFPGSLFSNFVLHR